MTKSNTGSPPPWAAFGWSVAAFLALLIGGMWLLTTAARHLPLWLCADRYVAAELEVTRFDPPSGPRNRGPRIEGVIHPGGEQVRAYSGDITITQFVDPNDRPGWRVPLREEIEGRRLAVLYWPEHDSVVRWWHSPTVVMPETVAGAGGLFLRNVLVVVAFVVVAVFCFRRG